MELSLSLPMLVSVTLARSGNLLDLSLPEVVSIGLLHGNLNKCHIWQLLGLSIKFASSGVFILGLLAMEVAKCGN